MGEGLREEVDWLVEEGLKVNSEGIGRDFGGICDFFYIEWSVPNQIIILRKSKNNL